MNKHRLEALTNHLEKGEAIHKVFDFSTVNKGDAVNVIRNLHDYDAVEPCGTHGCAMGELPALDPDYWEFCSLTGIRPRPEHYYEGTLQEYVTFYFQINAYEASGLFWPNPNRLFPWNTCTLRTTASKSEVIEAMKRFLAWKDQGNELDSLPLPNYLLHSLWGE